MAAGQRRTSQAFACRRCFADKELQEWIDQQLDLATGTCAWCRSRRARLIPLALLGPLFRTVATLYTENTGDSYSHDALDGDPIGYLIQGDWSTFSDTIDLDGNAPPLCQAILEAGLPPKTKDDVDYEPDYSNFFFSKSPTRSNAEDDWEERVDELLSPSKLPIGDQAPSPPEERRQHWMPDRLAYIIEELGDRYEGGMILYRARIHKDRERKRPFELHELAAPSPELADAGRANRKGQPVLYTATDEATAVAEVRPWRGAPVAVGEIALADTFKILDLTNFEPLSTPFFRDDIAWMVEARNLLWRLREELMRPVTPDDQDRQYKPTQYACELMRNAGFNGVAFPSAMGPGTNVVFFNPMAGLVTSVKYFRVHGVSYTFEVEARDEIRVDEFPY